MEDTLFKALIGLGGNGIFAAVLFYLLRYHMQASREQTKETQDQMCERISEQSARINTLEEGHRNCEQERQKSADIIVSLLQAQTGRRARNNGRGKK